MQADETKSEIKSGRRRRRAIRTRQAASAASAHARQRRQCAGGGDRFRHRCQSSRIGRRDRGKLRHAGVRRWPPHKHGTAIAGLIAAHGRLMGAAPGARILAIRAFDPADASAEGTTFNILKGLDWAAAHDARVINMSFAGPADPAIHRSLGCGAQERHRAGRGRRQCRRRNRRRFIPPPIRT